jgi:hypothetical protein
MPTAPALPPEALSSRSAQARPFSQALGSFPLETAEVARALNDDGARAAAARRSSLARALVRLFYRLEDRVRRNDGDDGFGDSQIAFGGSLRRDA